MIAGSLVSTVGFQSSPSPKAGSYYSPRITTYDWDGFNPLPARRPGATLQFWRAKITNLCFNPLPARRPGATPAIKLSIMIQTCFNPLPARRPGATVYEHFKVAPTPKFQSSPSPKAGSYPQVLTIP